MDSGKSPIGATHLSSMEVPTLREGLGIPARLMCRSVMTAWPLPLCHGMDEIAAFQLVPPTFCLNSKHSVGLGVLQRR